MDPQSQNNPTIIPQATLPTTSRRVYPLITIDRIKNPSRFFAIFIVGGLTKFIMLLPVFIILWAISIMWGVTQMVNAFSVLFRGKFYNPAYNLATQYVQLSIATYFYTCGLTNRYPFPYGLDASLKVEVPFPAAPNRFFAIPIVGFLVRIVLIIPFAVYASILTNAGLIMAMASSFSVFFKKYYPESTYQLVLDAARIYYADYLYLSGTSDTYPTFKISPKHLRVKIIFIILGAVWFVISLFLQFSNQSGRNTTDTNPILETTPLNSSISLGKLCEVSSECFYSNMLNNTRTTATIYNHYVVDGISFTQPTQITFEGYNNGKYTINVSTINVYSNENIPDTNTTLVNVKSITSNKKSTCVFNTENFRDEILKIWSTQTKLLGFPQGIYSCAQSVIPLTATQVNPALYISPSPTPIPETKNIPITSITIYPTPTTISGFPQ